MNLRFDTYYDNEDLKSALDQLAAEHPDLATLTSIGKSHEDRDLWLMTITNSATGPAAEKPALWIDGNLHASEVAGSMAALYTIDHLVRSRGTDALVTRLLDTTAFYILPRVNPDGAALALQRPPKVIRSGVRPYPYTDEDDGLVPEDIDGDGRILSMRIEDAAGTMKVSGTDPRLLVRRGPDEEGGTYYRVFPEGLIRNYDGHTIRLARPQQGLDFNRNFPAIWEGEGTQRGAGPFPGSEPETHAVIDFIAAHPNICGAITYHTYGGVHLRPLSFKSDDDLPTEDLWVYKLIGQRATETTGYPAVSVFHDFRYHPKETMTGAFDDWAYDQLGIFAWTTELWDIVGRAGIKDRKFIDWYRSHPEEDDLAILRWNDDNLGGAGFVAWTPFTHPQLGPVEIGGWDTLWTWRNPPAKFLEEEIEKNHRFSLVQASMAPRLEVRHLVAEPLGAGTAKVTLVVENTGFLPTYVSRRALERKMSRPVRIEVEGGVLVSGERVTEVGHLEGRSNKLDWTSTGATDNRVRREWVVRGDAGDRVVFHVISARAGTLHRELILP